MIPLYSNFPTPTLTKEQRTAQTEAEEMSRAIFHPLISQLAQLPIEEVPGFHAMVESVTREGVHVVPGERPRPVDNHRQDSPLC